MVKAKTLGILGLIVMTRIYLLKLRLVLRLTRLLANVIRSYG